MESEYIIVNKTLIQKRIEELKKEIEFYDKVGALSINPNKVKAETELSLLKQILSQSTPLIPEIEKGYDQGSYNHHSQHTKEYSDIKQRYISKLKLDII